MVVKELLLNLGVFATVNGFAESYFVDWFEIAGGN